MSEFKNALTYELETKIEKLREAIDYTPKPWVPPSPRPNDKKSLPFTILVTSDLQIPYFDRDLHELTCRLANDLQIDAWYDGGDEFDLPTLSRWEQRKARYYGDWDFGASVKETIEQGKQVFKDRSSAAPPWCAKKIIDSNHLERWDRYILDHAPELFGAVPGIRELAGLPENGWQIHLSDYGTGTYQMTELDVAPGLILIHGTVSKGLEKAGQSVMMELRHRVGVSVMQGHANHLAQVHLVRGGLGCEDRHVQFGYEIGTLSQLQMPYGDRRVKDWMQGFCVVTVWPEGQWNVELVPYLPESKYIIYRDKVYQL